MDNLYIFDCEVFACDWLFVFKRVADGQYIVIHNDPDALRFFIEERPWIAGFNNKHYDNFIIKAILAGATPEGVKAVNDLIIKEGVPGWEIPAIRDCHVWFDSFDLMDDCQMGLSLKAIEGHLGLNIQESDVDFDLNRQLTEEELKQTVRYCKHDVDATEALLRLRKDYLQTKADLGRNCGLTLEKALYMTNAKLTAAYLQAQPPAEPWTDERKYQYPDKLRREFIPPEVFAFFDRMHDPEISDDGLWSGKLEITVGGCPCTLGYGGIHGAISHYSEESNDARTIRNQDVASYYPHLVTLPLSDGWKYGYCSRNIHNPQIYADVLQSRVEAKRRGDKATEKPLKLVLNTTYGAMLNQYNALYDPLMGRSVCISGQLFLLELAVHLTQKCPTLRLIQLNTDGIMASFDLTDEPAWQSVTQEWQSRTGFTLEEDRIRKIIQKDVNNYIEIPEDGRPKIKGGQLVRGIAPAGAFNVNNNARVIARAVQEFFVNGTPPEKTVAACQDIHDFQLISKAGGKYTGCYQMQGQEKVPLQRVNRVYASRNKNLGTLYKTHAVTGRDSKIPSLPPHCAVDNDNHMDLKNVDRRWYVRQAKQTIDGFLGVSRRGKSQKAAKAEDHSKQEENMAEKKQNVLQKLAKARVEFLDQKISKSGINEHLEFEYFELADIVPAALRIFAELGLASHTTMDGEKAIMTVRNAEEPEESGIDFVLPYRENKPIVSNKGKEVTTPMQALGASVTYLRRYLWMLVLDITEPDSIDPNIGAKVPGIELPKTARNTSLVDRNAIKEELTGADGPADELQIDGLKAACKALLEADPEKESLVQELALKTNGFTQVTRSQCEKLVQCIGEMIAEISAGKEQA